MSRFILIFLLCLLPLCLHAQERILAYDSEVDIRADGQLDVTERITVRAEGQQIRRGIYRDFPTRYRDRAGNRVVVDFDMIEVLRDGRPEPWFTENIANGVRINTGDDDFLPTPGTFTFTLRYRTYRQVGFFDGHDELYWNAIGHGWVFPIESGKVEVRLPQPVPVEAMGLEGYTGHQGDRGQDFDTARPSNGTAHWQLTRPLAPRQGLTTVLTFPKGVVAEPSRAQRIGWLLRDNRGVLIALATLALVLVYCLRRWHQLGRDPTPGPVIARYDPPTERTPADLRFMHRMGRYDNRCFSADLLDMAVHGVLRIHHEKTLLKDEWSLEKTGGPSLPANHAGQNSLLSKLFARGATRLELKNTQASTISSAKLEHLKHLEKHFNPSHFKRNTGNVVIAWLMAAIGITAAFGLSGGGGIPLIILVTALTTTALIVFGVLVKAPTAEGRKLMDEIEGLKLYLGVAERDELKSMPGPDAPPLLDAGRYERLLPYAVALEVEDAWTKKFTIAAGAAAVAAATAGISWYRGSQIGDLGSFSKAMGSSLSSQIASSSSPPGSSSGSGGGGSSGGGGGGGGGGGR